MPIIFIGNLLKQKAVLFRSVSTNISFPWTQTLTDIYKEDSVISRYLGEGCVKGALRNVPNGKFDAKEFLYAAKNCVQIVSKVLHDSDKEDKLQEMVGSDLLGYLQQAMKKMVHANHPLSFCLEVKKIPRLSISGIRSLVGPYTTNDDHVYIDFGGQKVITSSSAFESLIKDGMPVNLNDCKRLAKESVGHGLRFQIDVKFTTQEKFYIVDVRTDKVLAGSKQIVSSYHLWQFESPFDWECYREGSYPLTWRVVDMDHYCKNNSPPPRIVKALNYRAPHNK